jgi:hypothetical protein
LVYLLTCGGDTATETKETKTMQSFTHALAHNLIGFKASTLRVRVLDSNETCVWVITADLLDAGTRLVLDQTQIEPLSDLVAA